MTSPEQEEWDRVARAGSAARRKVVLRGLVAAAAFAATFAGIFLGLGSVWAKSQAADAADREARLARGETVYVLRRRGETEGSRAGKELAWLVVLAAAGGSLAALGTFVALGGRLSPEHRRALEQLRR